MTPASSALPPGEAALRPPSGPPPDLKTLADAANEAAKGTAAVWVSFLSLAVYLAVAVGSTTHRVLFLAQPVKLPIFGVDLPLVGFYVIAPTLFVILHFYILVQLRTLAGKVGAFLGAAAREVGGEREALRLQCWRLDPFVVAQLLAAQRIRERAWALRTMAQITLVIGPVLLLLFFQLRFLPYHDVTTTWVHRVLILVDLLLLWRFWPLRAAPAVRGWARRARMVPAALSIAAVFSFAALVATLPEEDESRMEGRIRPIAELRSTLFITELRCTLFGYPGSPFARSLVLVDEDFVATDNARLAETRRTVSLAGRDLRRARLVGADLRKADFRNAQLQGAEFVGAQLQGADFEGAWPEGADFLGAQLQGANFEDAQLQRAKFGNARLQGANFENARLQGSDFLGAQLQGASFENAQLQGAKFGNARLQGSDFLGAQLQGASFESAQLQGASFENAQLQGANFDKANLWRAKELDTRWVNPKDVHHTPPPQAEREKLAAGWLASVPDEEMRERVRRRLSDFAAPDTIAAMPGICSTRRQCSAHPKPRDAAALPLLRRALEGGERVLGAEHPDTRQLRANLAQATRSGKP